MKHPLGMPEVFSDPDIHGGQPVLESGIPIYLILDMLAQGFSPEEMRRDYGITAEQVQLALRFAADYLKAEGAMPPQWSFLLDRGLNYRTKRALLAAGFPAVLQLVDVGLTGTSPPHRAP